MNSENKAAVFLENKMTVDEAYKVRPISEDRGREGKREGGRQVDFSVACLLHQTKLSRSPDISGRK